MRELLPMSGAFICFKNGYKQLSNIVLGVIVVCPECKDFMIIEQNTYADPVMIKNEVVDEIKQKMSKKYVFDLGEEGIYYVHTAICEACVDEKQKATDYVEAEDDILIQYLDLYQNIRDNKVAYMNAFINEDHYIGTINDLKIKAFNLTGYDKVKAAFISNSKRSISIALRKFIEESKEVIRDDFFQAFLSSAHYRMLKQDCANMLNMVPEVHKKINGQQLKRLFRLYKYDTESNVIRVIDSETSTCIGHKHFYAYPVEININSILSRLNEKEKHILKLNKDINHLDRLYERIDKRIRRVFNKKFSN